MNNQTESVVPTWLHDLFLGYGDPAKTQYKYLMANEETGEESIQAAVDFRDTFLSPDHFLESFPEAQEVTFTGTEADR